MTVDKEQLGDTIFRRGLLLVDIFIPSEQLETQQRVMYFRRQALTLCENKSSLRFLKLVIQESKRKMSGLPKFIWLHLKAFELMLR